MDVLGQPISNTVLRTYRSPRSSLYKPRTKVTSFLLGILTLEDVTDRLAQNIGKELLLYAA
jgi:hypothetical protein